MELQGHLSKAELACCAEAACAAALLPAERGSRAPASSGCTVGAAQASRNLTVQAGGTLPLEISGDQESDHTPKGTSLTRA